MTLRRTLAGFTLIELVVVAAVVMLLAALAIPRYANSVLRWRVESAARRIAADIALAQRHARTTSAAQRIEFNVAASSYTLSGMTHPDHPAQSYEVRLAAEPYRASLLSADFAGDATLIFNGHGLPDSGGEVLISAGALRYRVWVDAETGRVGTAEIFVGGP
jgi:type II secretory pathway pseudopilin PulG